MNDFPNNLISIGKFCDADCSVLFNKTTVKVFDCHGTVILQGFREPTGARLWRVNIYPTAAVAQTAHTHPPTTQPHLIIDDEYIPPIPTPTTSPTVHTLARISLPVLVPACLPSTPAPTPSTKSTEYHRRAYDLPSTKALVEYLHCTVGSPVKSQFLQAVKCGNYRSFPGLTATNVARYCPENATPTVLGHMTQVQKGLRSTQSALLATLTKPDDTLKIIEVGLGLHVVEVPIATLYTDDMGRFPIRAMSGNQYIMLAFQDAANVILVQAFQSKADHHRIPAYNTIMDRLTTRGHTVDMQILDNEASAAYINCINNTWNVRHQKVPPDMHRRNKAERAIRTFKAHFISILASVDPSFPKNRWDLLLPQAEITVNLLRQSATKPTISAWEHFNGPYNFDATPMGPPGCRVISHAKGSTRASS